MFVTALALALVLSVAAAQAKAGRLTAHGSVQQVYAVGLTPHATVSLLNRRGRVVATQRADSLGGIVFRQVTPGAGYRIKAGHARSAAVTVMPDRSAPPSTKAYDQKLPESGYGYLRTRDGTSLAIDVRLPGGPGARTRRWSSTRATATPTPRAPRAASAPWPTSWGSRSSTSTCAGPAARAARSTTSSRSRASTATTSSRRSRASRGCSVTASACSGISYGGISQLFVGATDPPHLAAITPLSVVDSTATTLYPGGILNTGFTLGWASGPRPRRAAGLADGRRAVGA